MLASVVIGAIMATGWSSASATRTIVGKTTLFSLKTFMRFSAVSYCSAVHKNLKWDCGELCGGVTTGTTILASFKHDIASIKGTGVGMVVVNRSLKTIAIIFRGTVLSTDDWRSDIYLNRRSGSWFNTLWDYKLPKPSNPGGDIFAPDNILLHSGFSENYQGVRAAVQKHLIDAMKKYPTYSVVFTGHSLGGALASLAIVDAAVYHGVAKAKKMSLFSYGQPRTGNNVFADWANGLPFKGVYRVTRMRDPIPRLPPKVLGYKHFGKEYYIRGDNVTVTCTATKEGEETANCVNSKRFRPSELAHTTGYYWASGCDGLNT
ncbi:hypothetical protein BASA50_005733 [Batrachochytrium salamandrivorans]|uniref:Fungal lipase-type domain-containing protein n=1 Tax=Batrachochytrium salamandrivorans TaxID=1357716 RepID=A0ABQ8FBU8_9FUNG|nr:hypothetical protein BASA61_005695 [Batrachochytrium salamandrivorans]KAH6595524.1 hypothetical protein BASA50_005733 [Batrachochytrium salamandrivorans]